MVNSLYNPFSEHDDYRFAQLRGRRKLIRWDQLHHMKWVPYDKTLMGQLKSQAIGCGRNLYLARAAHDGSITPGYLNTSKNRCYIPFGGKEHVKTECEVLCTPGHFVPCIDSNTMLRATPAGISEQGEPLYIGRVKHKGTYINGKVQRSHEVCYVPIDGKERNFKEYDIFIRSAVNPEVTDVAAPAVHHSDWVTAVDGQIPPNAVVGGRDGEDHYIGRAHHEGSLTPGKVVPSNGMCHVAWGGSEWYKEEFEVLCNVKGKFVPTIGDNIPATAYPAGKSEEGETLFIGRVNHEGTVALGKVHPSHRVCYIPYAGREISFRKYEIFVSESTQY